jgi:hypothetical protein
MGLFNNLMSKIFGHPAAGGSTSSGTQPSAASQGAATTTTATATQTSAPASTTATETQTVDVAAVLNEMAKTNPEKLDWKRSIVDLMKLVGMDSSLSARRQLATELHYTGDQNDTASMNMWLHKEVLKKLAENGGKVPQELLH